MKKFVFLYVGASEARTDETMKAWGDWFASVGESFIDSGNPFGPGRYVSKSGTTDLTMDKDAITGYSILNAESMKDAERIAATCPVVTGVRVFEALAM
jgi:hypothetical protein